MKKKVLIGIFTAIILIVAIFFGYSFLNRKPEKAPEIPPAPTATPQPTVDNSANQQTATQQIPDPMQEVISANQGDLFTDPNGELAPSYPRDLLPLYKVSSVADSNDITTDNGNPGWIAVYGSDADPETIAAFYRSLMHTASGFTETPSGASTNLKGNINGCSISVTISPNNPNRTGLSYVSDVNIFIERTQ